MCRVITSYDTSPFIIKAHISNPELVVLSARSRSAFGLDARVPQQPQGREAGASVHSVAGGIAGLWNNASVTCSILSRGRRLRPVRRAVRPEQRRGER